MVVLRMLAFRPAEQIKATAISTESTSPAPAVQGQAPAQSVAQPVSQPAPVQPPVQQQSVQQQQNPAQYSDSQGYADHSGNQGYPEQDYPHSQYDAPPAYDERPSYGTEKR